MSFPAVLLGQRSNFDAIQSTGPPVTKLVFMSIPLPSTAVGIKFTIISHDQGFSTASGQWTWFEASIIRPQTSEPTPIQAPVSVYETVEHFVQEIRDQSWDFVSVQSSQNDLDSEAESHSQISMLLRRNAVSPAWQTHEIYWDQGNGTSLDGNEPNFASALKKGDRVVVWALAQFPQWTNYIRSIRVEIFPPRDGTIASEDDEEDEEKMLEYAIALSLQKADNEDGEGVVSSKDRAIKNTDVTIRTIHGSHQAIYLNDLGVRLSKRFEDTGSIDDLNRAVDVADQAIQATPENHPDRAAMLYNLGRSLGKRFDRIGLTDDLNRAVDVVDKAVQTIPQDHPIRVISLSNLGYLLRRRFERTGSIYDLNRAVDVVDEAIQATPEGHPDRPGCLNSLGILFGRRFQRTGSIYDLNRAIDVADKAAQAIPEDHPDRAMYLSNLGYWLDERFERAGLIDDLKRAIDVAEKAAQTTPEDHPNQAGYLNSLGSSLGRRFERTGSIDDLNRAIEVADKSVQITPEDHPDRVIYLNSLGSSLGRRFEHTGSIDDLNRAVDIVGKAVKTTPKDHPDRVIYLSGLGNWLARRFERTGSIDDLNRAVDIADQAVRATPEGHYGQAMLLSSLGNSLGRRFMRTDSIEDLNRAIDVADKAVKATPEDHSYRAARLSGLGNSLGRRFIRTDSIDDLHRAIDAVDAAVKVTPEDHPDRPVYLNNLGNWLGRRFERTNSTDDLNRAIDVADKAGRATPEGHPNRAAWLNSLGYWLSRRSEVTGSIDDFDRALFAYKESSSNGSAPPSMRVHSARRAAELLIRQSDWQEASLLLEQAIQLLPNVSPRSLKHTDKQHQLGSFTGLASMAAAAALQAGRTESEALRFLELGRGVISGLLMDMRGDTSDLEQHYPHLAKEFSTLRDELDSPAHIYLSDGLSDFKVSLESQITRLHEVDQQFNKLLVEIRAKPEFQNFLFPPTEEEMMAAANPDPIIIVNMSQYRCDAFLVECDSIRVLELSNLTANEAQNQARLRSTTSLEWLWDSVAGPCLDELGFKKKASDDNLSRVWWIPTGYLSQLPLHAAGYHREDSGKTVLDRVMSSYTLSIKALKHGRQHHKQPRAPSNKALLVSMRTTPELDINKDLPFAKEEVEMLTGLCPSLRLEPITLTPPFKDKVLESLETCRIFHFAGHGQSDPAEPSRSCLLLGDKKLERLTVGELRDRRLQENPPFLGYLSACSTGANKAEKLVDEGIHLINAFQLAGFRHVVGTLWEVSDKHCVDVAEVLYRTILKEGMTDIAVCRGLHRALRALRDNRVEQVLQTLREGKIECEGDARDAELISKTQARVSSDLYWVPYVHYGV